MPKRQPNARELFQLALQGLDQSIHKPNILNYGEKDYPEQLRFHQSEKRGRFVSGGNRGGKTDAEVVEAIWWATDSHPYLERPLAWGAGPLQLRFVVVDIAKGVEQIIVPKLKRWIPNSYLVQNSWDKSWDNSNLILTFANGSTIDFVTWGMDMMKLGGVPRHGIFFDEEPPQHIFNESMMRLIDYNGFWVIAATPTKGMGWTFDLLWEPAQNDPDGMVDTFTLSAEQNPYIEADSDDMDFYTMGMDKEEREVREHGSFVARSGLVFPSVSSNFENHVVDFSRADIPRGWAIYASVDHGWNNPTAWLWHAVGPNGDIVTFAEHYRGQMTVAEHSAHVLERERAWKIHPDQVERMGDPAMKQTSGITGTSILTEYAINGVYINVEGIPRDVLVGVERMQTYFRPRPDSHWGPGRPKWVISRNCPNFLRELKKLRWATYSSDKQAYEMNKQEVIHKKDDHASDSARYFATTRPDLSPVAEPVLSPSEKTAVTVRYEELLLKMREDPEVTFADTYDTAWNTSYEVEVAGGGYYMEEDSNGD
jgi:phage terminase large subunit-like protein